MFIIAYIFTLIAGHGYCRDVKFKKKVDPGALQTEIRAQGIWVSYIQCSLDNCTIVMPDSEKRDPMPIVKKYIYVDPFEVRQKRLDRLRSLHVKWSLGSITPEEKDELLRETVGMTLGR